MKKRMSEFEKHVRKWLIDHEVGMGWLVRRVSEMSGAYCDYSLIGKCMRGQVKSGKALDALCALTLWKR